MLIWFLWQIILVILLLKFCDLKFKLTLVIIWKSLDWVQIGHKCSKLVTKTQIGKSVIMSSTRCSSLKMMKTSNWRLSSLWACLWYLRRRTNLLGSCRLSLTFWTRKISRLGSSALKRRKISWEPWSLKMPLRLSVALTRNLRTLIRFQNQGREAQSRQKKTSRKKRFSIRSMSYRVRTK